MPFRFAAHFIIAMIGITIVAFWPGYFSTLASAPWGFHFHGITASLWMLLLAFQSWSIHSRQRALHRIGGISSLVLFPFFLAGGMAVLVSMAQATPLNPFYQLYGTVWASWMRRRRSFSDGSIFTRFPSGGTCSCMRVSCSPHHCCLSCRSVRGS